ncbi:Metallo-dependent phosphatase-like protein [Umbelopsis sp. PMI_123]|nr:Metallo-dependent phosphatase-like protein [Umbelopsis sp. PMI_123]
MFDIIQLYITIARFKLRNSLYDNGWISCNSIRKQPALFVIDTRHVQVVWEANCGFKDHDLLVTWRVSDDPQDPEFNEYGITKTIVPTVLDEHHKIYKAILGPLPISANYTYSILSSPQNPPHRRRILAEYKFPWHPTAEHTPTARNPIRFVAIADNQFGLKTFTKVVRRIAHRGPFDYVIHAGDAVQNYPSLQQWQTDFYDPLTKYRLVQTTPIIYAHGNHDHDVSLEYHYTRHDNKQHFPWYSYTIASGAVKVIVLDSNLDYLDQDSWLKAELESEESRLAKFRIVVVHIPPFMEFWDPIPWSQGESEWGRFVRDRFVPLFELYGVDLVISGHQHNYERGERNGVMYSIIGGAGGDLDYDRVDDWNMYQKTEVNFHFVTIDIFQVDVERWQLQWEMLDLYGKSIDRTTILSRPPQEPMVNQPQPPILDTPSQPQLDESLSHDWDLSGDMDWQDLELAAENE